MGCYCDYDPSTVWDVTEPKARKEHRCCECLGIIRPGERYKRVGSLFEGSWSTYKRCTDCQHVMCEISKVIECWCDVWGEFHERFGTELSENYNKQKDLRRIAGMFNAVAEARNGKKIYIPDEDDN